MNWQERAAYILLYIGLAILVSLLYVSCLSMGIITVTQ